MIIWQRAKRSPTVAWLATKQKRIYLNSILWQVQFTSIKNIENVKEEIKLLWKPLAWGEVTYQYLPPKIYSTSLALLWLVAVSRTGRPLIPFRRVLLSQDIAKQSPLQWLREGGRNRYITAMRCCLLLLHPWATLVQAFLPTSCHLNDCTGPRRIPLKYVVLYYFCLLVALNVFYVARSLKT